MLLRRGLCFSRLERYFLDPNTPHLERYPPGDSGVGLETDAFVRVPMAWSYSKRFHINFGNDSPTWRSAKIPIDCTLVRAPISP